MPQCTPQSWSIPYNLSLQLTKCPPVIDLYCQDNDSKHMSRHTQDFFEQKGINWWRTPTESPDLNPTKNLWHELKEFICREAKPKTKQSLIDRILAF